MTVGPIGTPDWSKSVPGGTHVLLNVSVNTPTADYTSPLISCSAYNGLYMECFLTGGVGNLMQVRVEFYDDPTGTIPTTSTLAYAVQNNNIELNLPVLGPYCKVHLISTVAATITASRVMLIGHNGGPAASVRAASNMLADVSTGALAAGATQTTNVRQMCEGFGYLSWNNDIQPGWIQVVALDSNGAAHPILFSVLGGAGQAAVIALAIPPQPLQINLHNSGSATDSYSAALWLARA